MMRTTVKRLLALVGLLAFATMSCGLAQAVTPSPPPSAPPPTPTVESGRIAAETGGQVLGPDGVIFEAPADGISQDTKVTIENTGGGEPLNEASPLKSASPEYTIDLGDAEVVNGLTLTVPLPQAHLGDRLAAASGEMVYVGRTYTEDGTARMLGVKVKNGQATMPVVAAGKYQLYMILKPFLVDPHAPLHVPSYPQLTPAWCSPTALTDLAQFHQGAWPVGGDGSLFGESSNYFLAGQAGQPLNTGYFFHWLLGAAGYTVPGDVKQSFANYDLEVMIWWIGGGMDPEYNEYMWGAFRAYVESYLWGDNMAQRPVAWGSSIAHHSRIITGSDGTDFYYNETGNGGVNYQKSWQSYHDDAVQLLDDGEVTDTVVMFKPPRPENQRRGVLWLWPQSGVEDGSISLHSAPSGEAASYWHWDGSNGRSYGYYYDDPQGQNPSDPTLDYAFKLLSADDYLVYRFKVASISDQAYDFQVKVEIGPDGGPYTLVGTHNSPGPLGAKAIWGPEQGSAVIGGLPTGLNTLKFTLSQGSVIQDVKYVKFSIAPLSVLEIPELVPEKPDFGLGDPVLSTPGIYYRGTGCGTHQETFQIQALDPNIYSVVLFYRLKGADGETTRFNQGVAMRPTGDGWYEYPLTAESVEGFTQFEQANLQYQFVATDKNGDEVARSPVFSDVEFAACHR
ncbi:MAG: hypothetical protein WBR18_12555 [Anaerolineales bacterium]